MSLSYGFYNSKDHDRRYNAIQISSIFDGIINDGIFMSIGDRFEVTADGSSMSVIVGKGRAWFNHTWTLNDALMPIPVPEAEVVMNRYDAIVLEINSESLVRANSIKLISGTPSSQPEYPVLINTDMVHQYPLAYIYVESGAKTIRQADITSMIGKGETPYVTGIIETINIESMVSKWEDQWLKFFEKQETDITETAEKWKKEWNDFFDSYNSEMDSEKTKWEELWHEWYHMYTNSSAEEFSNWKLQQKNDFITWFSELRDMLSEEVEAKMANEILDLKKKVEDLETFKQNIIEELVINQSAYDSYNDVLTDSKGVPITNRILFPSGTNASSLIAEEFSEEKDYTAGAYCIYEKQLWIFTQGKLAGTWDETVVENVTVTGRITYLQQHSLLDSNQEVPK